MLDRTLLRRGLLSVRLTPAQIGTAQHYAWLESIVKALLVLNLFDAVFTLWWVGTGHATEANIFLSDLVDRPLLFIVVKLSLVSLGSIFLWRMRTRPLAVVAIFGSFFVYYLVLLHHIRLSTLWIAEAARVVPF